MPPKAAPQPVSADTGRRDLWHVDSNGTLCVNLHEGQSKAFQSTKRITLVMAGVQSGKCLRTPLDMADGTTRHPRDLRPGDRVLALDQTTLRIVTDTVKRAWSNGIRPIYRLRTRTGRENDASGNHPYFTPDGWKPLEELKAGDWIAVPRQLPDADPQIARAATPMQREFDTNRLVGYLLGDGGLTGGSVMFSNVDEGVLDDVREIISEHFSPCKMVHSDRCTYRVVGYGRGRSSTNPVLDLLKRIGMMGKGAAEKCVPDYILTQPRELVAAFLQGLFTTDGWADDKGIGFCTKSRRLATEVQALLLRFGIIARLRERVASSTSDPGSPYFGRKFKSYSLETKSIRDCREFALSIGFVGEKQRRFRSMMAEKEAKGRNFDGKDVVPHFPKRELAGCLVKTPENTPLGPREGYRGKDASLYAVLRRARNEATCRENAQELTIAFLGHAPKELHSRCAALAYSGIYWDKVESVTYVEDAEVWDVETTTHHTLIAGGIVSHNTSMGPIWLYDRIQRIGPGDYLAVAPTHPLMNMKMLPEFLRFFEQTLRLGHWQASKKTFTFTDDGFHRMFGHKPTLNDPPTRVIFGSATNPDSIESASAKAAWLDEAGQDDFTLQAWDAILGRLSLAATPLVENYRARNHIFVPTKLNPVPPPPLPGGPILITTTPYNLGWMKQELFDKDKNGQRSDVLVVNFASTMNPAFPREEYEARRRTMQRWRFDMRYNGIFTRPAGLIYSAFRDEPLYAAQARAQVRAQARAKPAGGRTATPASPNSGHRVPHFFPPYHWRRFAGVDFGAVNTCFVFLLEVPPHPDYSGDHSIKRTPLWMDDAANIYALAPSDPPHLPKYIVYRCVMFGAGDDTPDMETAQFVRRAQQFARMDGIHPEDIRWCGGAPGEKQWRVDYNAAGLPVAQPHVKDVEAGIDYVSGAFTNNQLFVMEPPDLGGDPGDSSDPSAVLHDRDPGDPLVMQAAGLYRFVEELNTYSRKLDDMLEPTDEIKDKNRFHAMDALRYAVLLTSLSPAASMYTESEIRSKFEHLNRHRPVGGPLRRAGDNATSGERQQDGMPSLREMAMNGAHSGSVRRRGVPWGDLTW